MIARRWIVAGVAAAALLLGGRALASAVLELRWYQSMGAADVWWARVGTTSALRLLCALVAGAFAFANLLAVRHSVVSLVLPRRVGNIEIGEEVPGRSLVLTAGVLASILGALLALPMDDWSAALLARYGRSFGETDPYFQRDIGFYVFWLPLETALYHWTLVTIAAVIAVVVLLYALTPSLRWDRRRLYVSSYVRRHLTTLGGVLLLVLAWSYRLDNYHLLIEGAGAAGAFTSVDHRVGIPGSLLLSLVTGAAAMVVIFAGWSGQTRLAFLAVTAVLLVALVVRVVAPAVVRRDRDTDPVVRELPYIATRAGYSRRAFAVDRVARPPARLDARRLMELPLTVSAWDSRALLAALDPRATAPEADPALAWRPGPAGLEVTLPTHPDATDGEGATWNVARVFAAATEPTGDPVRASGSAEGTDAASAVGPIIVRPGADGHAIIADPAAQVIGVPLEGRASRLMYGWALQDLSVAAGEGARQRTTLVLHRDVRARLEALVPFLTQGHDVTPILLGDSLYWSVDLYATSRFYPLSHPVTVNGEDWWYLHRSAVALVHAHTGRTRIIPVGSSDPITATWRSIFPQLFAPASALPQSVADALPPAKEEAFVQATTFARYGSRIEGSSPRSLPARDGSDPRLTGDLTPQRLSDGRLALVQPLLDAEDRIAGLLLAIGGETRETYWQPLTAPGPRWPAALDRLRGASRQVPPARLPIVRGPVRVAPFDGSVVLFQSAYTWREGRPPTLARVAVWARDTLRSGTSLAGALGNVSPDSASSVTSDSRARARALELYDAMRAALRRGDLSGFGAAFDSLGRALGRAVP